MSEPALEESEQELLKSLHSKKSGEEKLLKLGLHMISWQKSERDKINSFYDKYTAPLYNIINLMNDRMTKLEDAQVISNKAQQDTSKALHEVVVEVKHMVKCVDHAIIENKEDKTRYANQQREQDHRIDQVEKDLIKVQTQSSTNWGLFGKVFGGFITISGVIVAIIFGILQITK